MKPIVIAHWGASGRPIHRSTGALLLAEPMTAGSTDPRRVFIQSFELANLIELRRVAGARAP